MKETTKKLTEWAINKIKTEYPNDVALLIAVHGHSVNNDGHGECFDYFVPATERGNELSQTFIIDGVGHDLYPRSWERTERTANLDELPTICLGNSKILYSRSKEDEERFQLLKKKLFDNLSNKTFVYQKALESLDIAMDIYRTMMFEDALYKVRKGTGFIYFYLSNAVYLLNGTYSGANDWTNGAIAELLKLKELPDNFTEYYKALLNANSVSDLKSLAHLIIGTFRQFIAARKPVKQENLLNPNYEYLAEWFQELSLTLRRIRYYCVIGNSDAAFGDACFFQNEYDIIKEEFGLAEQDLLGYYNSADLSEISKRTDEIEAYIVSIIENNGVKIKKYATVESFLAEN